MMTHKPFFLAFAAVVFAAVATSTFASDDMNYEKCVGSTKTQAGMTRCATEAYQRAEQERNQLEQRLLSRLKLDDPVREAFKASESAWETSRQADCTLKTARMAAGDKRQMQFDLCMLNLTRDRINFALQDRLDCATLGDDVARRECAIPAGKQ